MISCAELLVKLKQLGVKLDVDGDRLTIDAPKGVFNDDLKHQLKQNKSELVELLKSSKNMTDWQNQPIKRVDRSKEQPLSYAQQRLWFLDQVVPGLTAYNIPLGFRINGQLVVEALSDAINQIVSRHEILRTTFSIVDVNAIQKIHPNQSAEVPFIRLSDKVKPEHELQRLIKVSVNQAFDLQSGPLLRIELYQLDENEYFLLINIHHCVFDGWSINIFIKELLELYDAVVEGRAHNLDSLSVQYADYSAWQKQWIDEHILEQQLNFWQRQLSDLSDPIELPLDNPRPKLQEFDGATTGFTLHRKQLAELTELSIAEDASLFMVLLAALKIVLYKYSGTRDLCVGTAVANRNHDALENLIGCFANTLVLRTKLDSDMTVRQLIASVKSTCLDAYSNQDLPFERLVEEINPGRDPSRSPLFQVLCTYQDDTGQDLTANAIQLFPDNPASQSARMDLAIDIIKTENGLEVVFEYASALFESATMQQMAAHFNYLLKQMKEQVNQSLSAMSLVSEEEKQNLTARYKGYERDYGKEDFVAGLFSKNASILADKVAVIANGRSISYADLESRSNQMGRLLIASGVTPGSLIGLCVDRSEQMLITLLGILKIACAYVPMDPEYPVDRLQYMGQDAGIKHLITQKNYLNLFADVNRVLDCEELQAKLPEQSPETLNIVVKKDDPAYVIYTSGSTGKPKGVVVPNGAVKNFLLSMAEKPGLDKDDRLLAVTTLSFDIAVLELYLPLVVGATVVIATRDEAMDGSSLLALIKSNNISFMQATPATWRMLLGSGLNRENPMKVLSGGEALPQDLALQLCKMEGELWNMYGPTETTVWSTCERIVDPTLAISLGEPIANTQLYILDEYHQLVPQGVAGELNIGGAGLALGYVNRPELTDERFVNHHAGLGRLYRTGDRMRFRRDGSLQYLGRLDDQVKLRGYRIELGEIETVMRKHPRIKDCALAIRQQGGGDARLLAYVIWQEQALTLTEVRQFLRNWMPAFMVPQAIIELESLPRTSNGKLDRKALPDTFQTLGSESEYEEPVTSEERWLADIWRTVIGVDKVGLYDNFFELGGHSLLSMQVIIKVRDEFNVKLNPRDLLLDSLTHVAAKITKYQASKGRHREDNSGHLAKKNLFRRLFG